MKKILFLFLIIAIVACEPPLKTYTCKVEKCWPLVPKSDTIQVESDCEPITEIYHGQPVLFYHQSGLEREYIIGVCSVKILNVK